MATPFNKRNKFNLSHEKKFTCDMGFGVPFYRQFVLPGDTFKVRTDMITKLQALIAPIYHRVNIRTRFFFVPARLCMEPGAFEKFITGGIDGKDNTAFPKITLTPTKGSLADYFGLPIGKEITVSALPFRAYNLIYNEWYRNETLQEERKVSLAAGADTTTDTTLFPVNWQRDYFTSALPWAQRGEQVLAPLAGTAPVKLNPGATNNVTINSIDDNGTNQLMTFKRGDNSNWSTSSLNMYPASIGASIGVMNIANNEGSAARYNSGLFAKINQNTQLYTDLTSASGASINDWRVAFQIQRLLEKNARGGARYVEWLLSHFGVRSSDARLQRPEYLGGGISSIGISEVVQVSSTDSTSPQGNRAGLGFSASRSNSFTKSFDEHGYIIGIMSILPMTNYQQGIERDWLYETRYDFPLPVFAHLGEQGIYNKELYVSGTPTDDEIFGYGPRFEECRHTYSSVAGDFRDTLNFWHMGRIFENKPSLNADFVKSSPTKRIFATPETGQHCLIDLVNVVKAIRCLPKHGIPGLIDHN